MIEHALRLGDVAELTFGNAFESARFSDMPIGPRLLRGDNIGFGAARWNVTKYWPQEQDSADEFVNLQLIPGDVVLAMDRPWVADGLKYAFIRAADVPALLVQRTARIRGGPALDQRFLRWLIAGQDFAEHVLAVQTGTTIPHISGRQIADYLIRRLPPLDEQRAIADMLGALDDKIESNRRIVEAARDLAKLSLQVASRGAPVVRIGDVATVERGLAYTSAGLATHGTPMVNLGNAENFGWLKRSGFKWYVGPHKDRHLVAPRVCS